MTIEEFQEAGPDGLSGLLLALWWDGKGDWEKAHMIAQDVDGPDGAWVHAYLHRREGDIGNAGYWYRQARRPTATGGLREEWEGIVGELLGR
ncbi:hypothetical protein [Granulicella sibirica]|uniref:Uncharacterized protein n=1 Tax=Granulicella sibirica TaxID=2479048 RepID=A0A4Q0SZ19_9BACT|nr:hypothetical protein [Granulicella sibirica]RXH56485.1 hypothetical protein GRAN_3342 [Granulicella sibirica]